MDLRYTRRFDGFCLVSSDSDFTGLALRIREEGLMVYGFGEQKTPEAFRDACHKFLFTEVLQPVVAAQSEPLNAAESQTKGTPAGAPPPPASSKGGAPSVEAPSLPVVSQGGVKRDAIPVQVCIFQE